MVYFDSIHNTMVYYAHLETLEILALIYILILSRNESENKKTYISRRCKRANTAAAHRHLIRNGGFYTANCHNAYEHRKQIRLG